MTDVYKCSIKIQKLEKYEKYLARLHIESNKKMSQQLTDVIYLIDFFLFY
jgi:hypothetical protein